MGRGMVLLLPIFSSRDLRIPCFPLMCRRCTGLLAFMLYKSGITSGPREKGMKKGSNCEGEQESSRTTLSR